MRIVALIAGLLVVLAAQPQEIYRWVDRNGVVHYSDQPGAPDAKLVEVAGLNTYEPAEAAGAAQASPRATPRSEPQEPEYRSVRIASPQPDETFFGADVSVVASAELDGELTPGHSVVFFLDGERVADSGGLSAQLPDLARGSHFLRAAVLDQNGAIRITSPQITFHVREPSVQNPQNPLVRPPPANRPPPTRPPPPPPKRP